MRLVPQRLGIGFGLDNSPEKQKSSQRSRRPLGALKHGYCDRRWQSTDTLWRYYTRLPVEKQALSKSAASPSAEALHFPAGQVILNLSVSEPTGKVHRVSSVPSPCGTMAFFVFSAVSGNKASRTDSFWPCSLFDIDLLPVRKPDPVLRTGRSVHIYTSSIIRKRKKDCDYEISGAGTYFPSP